MDVHAWTDQTVGPALIGRDLELALARDLLSRADVRLVVLLGTGGIGKTRLARQVGLDLRGAFELGAVFVDLAPLSGPGQVLPAVCAALGVQAHPSPLQALARRIGDRGVLLILDNLEHLPEPELDVVALGDHLPSARLLVTSRRVLHVRHARELPLTPLALPPRPEDAPRSPAVQLFVQRAQEVDPEFMLTPENAPLVSGVCSALGGLPLALELAAARLRAVDLPGLLGWLNTPLDVLDGGPLGDAPRSRSLRDAVRWSYDLLTPGEQAVFAACGAFRGGFTLAALEAVTGRADTRAVLIRLVEHSLIRRAEGTPSRWNLLEPVREFAAELLRTSGNTAPLERHARHFLAMAAETSPLESRPTPERCAQLTAEEPNLLGALDHLLDTGQLEQAQDLAWGLVPFWFARGQPALGFGHVQRVLTWPGARPSLRRANLCANAAGLASRAGLHDQAEHWARASVTLYGELGDRAGEVSALSNLADIYSTRGEPERAIPLFRETLGKLVSLGDVLSEGYTSHNLAATLSQSGQYAASLPHFERALAVWAQVGDPVGTMYTSGVRAVQHLRHQRLAEGRADARRAWTLGRDAQDVIFREALLFIGGLLAARLGQLPLGVRLTAASETLRAQTDMHIPVRCEQERTDLIQELRAALSPAAFESAWTQGTRASPQDVTADLDAAMQAEPARPGAPAELTARELEVLVGVALGHGDKRIAQTLGISAGTVGKHVASMLRKLDLHNRVELARWAVERHLPP